MSYRLLLANCHKVVQYASTTKPPITKPPMHPYIMESLMIPFVQFCDSASSRTQGCENNVLSKKLCSNNKLTVKQDQEYAAQKRNAEAEMYLNSLSEDMKKKRNQIEMFIESMQRQEGMVPDHISALDMKIMLKETSGTRKAVRKYCWHLCKKNYAAVNKKKIQKERKQEKRRKQVEGRVGDGLDDHNISIHYARRYVFEKQWQKIRALLHGYPVIIDLDYDLKIREENIVHVQLKSFLGSNTLNPLLLQFTSVHRNSLFSSLVESKASNNMAAEFYGEHFTELYPKNKLVYLSPDGEPYNRFDRNKIYIIGGCHDKYSYRPRESYIKARELGIECRSFPIHQYFKLKKIKQKNASFPIDVSLKILQDVMVSGDWKTALQANISGTFEPKIDKPSYQSNISQLLQKS